MPRYVWFSLLLSLPLSAAIVPGPELPLTAPALEESALFERDPAIASGGDGHLAVWSEEGALRATRISNAGLALDSLPLVVAASDVYEAQADVAFGNGRYLVVFQSAADVHYRFVAPDGSMSTETSLGEGFDPRVEFGGGSFFVTWRVSPFETRSARVSPESPVAIGEASSVRPEPVFANGAFHVVTSWNDEIVVTRNGGRRVIGTRSTPPAEPLWLWASSVNDTLVVAWRDGESVKFVRGNGAVESFATSLHVDALFGDLLLLSDDTNLYVQPLGGAIVETIPTPKPMRVFGAAGDLLVTHAYVAKQDDELFLVSRTAKTFTHLALAPPLQQQPDIATAGDVSLAVWKESGIGAALIGANGTITPLGFLTNNELAAAPRVAWNGELWLVTWAVGSFDFAVFGRHVRRDGTFVEAKPFPIAAPIFSNVTSLAWDGERFTLVFLRGRTVRLGVASTVIAARIHPDRIEETPLSSEESNAAPVIVHGANSTLVVWEEQWFPHRARGVLLSQSGTRTPVEFPVDDFSYGTPAAAWNGTTFVVAQNYVNRLQWFFVSESGVVTFAPEAATLPAGSGPLHLSARGERFLLLSTGDAAVLDSRGFVAEALTRIVPDANPRASGDWVIYVKAPDPARPTLTRVFVRKLGVAANPPRRRAVR